MEIVKKNKCTGCKMCADICPKMAIDFITDTEGFWYPVVDDNKCNKCSLCIKKCPINAMKQLEQEPEVFAAWSRNEDVRKDSTSGGIFFELARQWIADGGYIVGCVFSEDYKTVYHYLGRTMEDLKKIMGSKYFQSDTAGIYKKIKELLMQGKKILFCGTPCHIAALNSYLGKKYDNLLSCDFICRGINSPKAYQSFIKELEQQYHSNIVYVRFKDKRFGWQNLTTNVRFENKKEYAATKANDPWVIGYVKGNLYMRPSCYSCNFKTIPRGSDISLGDFWGGQGFSEKNYHDGISVVLINSKKARFYFDNISSIEKNNRLLEDVLPFNPCLLQSAVKNVYRSDFFKAIDHMTFSKAVRKYTGRKGIKHYIGALRRKLLKKNEESN